MTISHDQLRQDLKTRAAILRERNVPEVWSDFCGEVWAEFEQRRLSYADFTADDLNSIATRFDKEPRAILRALAYVKLAGETQNSPTAPAANAAATEDDSQNADPPSSRKP